MLNLIKLSLLGLTIFVSTFAWAERVFVKAGNIYYAQKNKPTLQITHSGKDSGPILSPNHDVIAFIREGNQPIPSGCYDTVSTNETYPGQIWIYDVEKKTERLLVANNFNCDKPQEKIVDPHGLQFSPNSKQLYFLTSAWTTSGALHSVNIEDNQQHYLIPANSLEVVMKGQYQGNVLVRQHRYFIGGGSYDWIWLFTPEGKEQGPLGDDISPSQREYLDMML